MSEQVNEQKALTPAEAFARLAEGREQVEAKTLLATFDLDGVEVTLALPNQSAFYTAMRAAQTASVADMVNSMGPSLEKGDAAAQAALKGILADPARIARAAQVQELAGYVRSVRDPKISITGEDMVTAGWLERRGVPVRGVEPEYRLPMSPEIVAFVLEGSDDFFWWTHGRLTNVAAFMDKVREAERKNSEPSPSGEREATAMEDAPTAEPTPGSSPEGTDS